MVYQTMGELMDEETYRVLKMLNPENFDSHKMLFGFGTYLDEFMMEMEGEYLYIKFKEPRVMTEFISFLQGETHIAPVLVSPNECHVPYSMVIDVPWMKDLPGYIAHFFYKRYV